MRPRSPRIWAFGWMVLASCNGLADPGIEYACFSPSSPYVEQFDAGYDALVDSCWTAKNARPGDIRVAESDLAIRHAEAAPFQGRAPMLVRRIEGDFVIVTKAEASSGLQSNFCGMALEDAAGIVVRGNGVVASFLVSPYLDSTALQLGRTPENVSCEENAAKLPRAVAFAQTTDPDSPRVYSPGIGIDGEADIAICRKGNRIAYLYRDPEDPEAAWNPTDWKLLQNEDQTDKTDAVGPGVLEVGLTTTLSEHGAIELGVEGHFNWAALLAVPHECMDPLETLAEPASD